VDQQKKNRHALKYNPVDLKACLSQLPIESLGTVHDSAHGLDMPFYTFFKYTKTHQAFHSVSIALKPRFAQQHKINRLEFARNKINNTGEYYQTQYNLIHYIDEKSSALTRKPSGYLLEMVQSFCIGRRLCCSSLDSRGRRGQFDGDSIDGMFELDYGDKFL
jgi:hypothetical protein